jgi:multidrug efflux pump subunit AcrA (membrane-fusion protein)
MSISARRARLLAVLGLIPLLVIGCGERKQAQPPERIVTVTTAQVVQKDLPVTESAVGMETALGMALDYDPTRTRGGTVFVRLPFPEQVADKLRLGQAVMLSSFADPSKSVRGQIREIRPALSATTLSRDVIVAVSSGGWRPAGSIRGEVTLGVNRGALVVPEQAVVLRPKGSVIYAIDGDLARERAVKTGIIRDGLIEVLSGVQTGETVVVDGAALLSDSTKIKVRDTGAAGGPETPGAVARNAS